MAAAGPVSKRAPMRLAAYEHSALMRGHPESEHAPCEAASVKCHAGGMAIMPLTDQFGGIGAAASRIPSAISGG